MKGESQGWDKGLEYETLKKMIISKYNILSQKETRRNIKAISYLTIYAIQLRNALRISESVEAFMRFLFEVYPNIKGKKEEKIKTQVLVEKKKYVSYVNGTWKYKKLDFREAYYPSWFPNKQMKFETFISRLLEKSYIVDMYRPVYNDYMNYLNELAEIIKNKIEKVPERPKSFEKLVDKVKRNAINLLKVNTHTLRYAYITYLVEHGYNVSLIAKITHHSNLNYILKYTQQKEANKILENME